jgi:nitroreductase/NAD-dependent dihydropyrimidine dehydrogenase PreA subunit
MTTIIIDTDLCTRCAICAQVCPMGIIDPADENRLPQVPGPKEFICITCGHCEVSCPSRALTLNFQLDEPERYVTCAPELTRDEMGYYLKKRRSVRHYAKKAVPKETIEAILDIARYAPSGGNQQPVQWLVIHDPAEVHRLAGLVIDWMRHDATSASPVLPKQFTDSLIAAWEHGIDPICRGAPHLLVAHVPEGPGSGQIDGIIALTYADCAAPAFGVGMCWAGFLSMAAGAYEPFKDALLLPAGRVFSYALMFGYPQYKTFGIPRRKPVQVTWR